MSDEYDISIERTGRIWRHLILSRQLADSWVTMECGRWNVPGGRWAESKARRVMRAAVRRAEYCAEGNHVPTRGQRSVSVVRIPVRPSVAPPPPPPSGFRAVLLPGEAVVPLPRRRGEQT